LIFGQFTQSLDIVEELLIKRHLPSVKYLRLDGKVPVSKRAAVVDMFNQDDSFKLMLLTTKIGGLGLNLTGADTVIFLEHDWNPHSDLQAMDRAHRIGQKRTVHVYQLVTMNSIEEKLMSMQEVS
jgi:TATA-binding protein-associated factor